MHLIIFITKELWGFVFIISFSLYAEKSALLKKHATAGCSVANDDASILNQHCWCWCWFHVCQNPSHSVTKQNNWKNSNKIEQFLQFFNTNWASGHSPRWDLDAGGGGTPGVLQGQWQLPPPFIFLILLFLFSAYLHLYFSSVIHFAHSHTKRQNTQRQTFHLILPLFWFSWLSSPSTGGYLYLSICKVGWRCS